MQARPGEERAVGLAFLYFFLLLCSYYLLRPLRDAMAPVAGFNILAWLFTATFVVMLVLAPFFGMLVSRVRKQFLLPISYGFFALNLLAFYLLFRFMPDSRWVAIAFFIWLSVFNMFVVSIFWSFMVDVFRDEEAKRLFGPIAAGGGTGAIIGPILTQTLAERIGVDGVVGLSMLLLLATLPCIRGLARWAERRHGHFVLPPNDPGARIGGTSLAGMRLVAQSPYLLGIFAIIAIGSIAGTFMYIELQHIAADAYPEVGARTTFYARLDVAVNVLTFLFQGFVAAWLMRRFELGGALLVTPAIALASFAWLAAMPQLMPLAISQVIRRAGDFGIGRPCREVLFTIVDPESKYKAKNFIDTVLQRFGDMVGGWLHLLLSAAGIALAGFAVLCGA
ncbi:MAG: NTP/NDP exchange transporter, partial [Burkholderiales bacterium]